MVGEYKPRCFYNFQASRLKDNPREMRREFLKAAEMYLNCSKPAKAAICLQNAKELELAAELFEKLSQVNWLQVFSPL